MDATTPEIRLIIGSTDAVELTMAPIIAGQMIVALQTAVADFKAAHGFPHLDT